MAAEKRVEVEETPEGEQEDWVEEEEQQKKDAHRDNLKRRIRSKRKTERRKAKVSGEIPRLGSGLTVSFILQLPFSPFVKGFFKRPFYYSGRQKRIANATPVMYLRIFECFFSFSKKVENNFQTSIRNNDASW